MALFDRFRKNNQKLVGTVTDPALSRLIKAHCKKLDKTTSGLSRKTSDFLHTGQPETLLIELQGNQTLFEGLGFYYGSSTEQAHIKMLDLPAAAQAHFLLRLGSLWTIALRSQHSGQGPSKFPDWLSSLLLQSDHYSHGRSRNAETGPKGLTFNAVLQACEIDGVDPLDIIEAIMTEAGDWSSDNVLRAASSLIGLPSFFTENIEHVAHCLSQSKGAAREMALNILQTSKIDLEPLVPALTVIATGSAKVAAATALALLAPYQEVTKTELQHLLQAGAAPQREKSAKLLHQLYGDEILPMLANHLEREKAARVKETIEQILAGGDQTGVTADNKLTIPPVVPLDLSNKLPAELEAELQKIFDAQYAKDKQFYDSRSKADGWKPSKPRPVSAKQIKRAFEFINSANDLSKEVADNNISFRYYAAHEAFANLIIQHPDGNLLHILRWAHYSNELYRNNIFSTDSVTQIMQSQGIDLRQLAAAAKQLNLNIENNIGIDWLQYWATPALPAEAVWPYFAEHEEVLKMGLGLVESDAFRHYYRDDALRATLQVLTLFPSPIASLVPYLFDMAMAGAKNKRQLARDALKPLPNACERIIKALESGQQDMRAGAADWLADIQVKDALPALRKALKKEKRDIAKAAILSALEKLGEDVNQYLDRDGLAKEADKALAKGLPKQLEWFPFDALPPLHWADNGDTVPSNIVRWWVVQSVKLKTPEPSPLLRKYLQLIKSNDAKDLGHFVLSAWLHQDTRACTEAEAVEQAKQDWKNYQGYSWYVSQYKTEDNYIKLQTQALMNTPIGSASKEKGMLAIPACIADERHAEIAGRYIKHWYGRRMAQCKALLLMLHWTEHQTAVQLQLSIARRFRTKGIREEAQRLVTELAERKGWSLDQLADRTIPTAGLDETAGMELNYGVTKVNVLLDDNFKFLIEKEDGKRIKSLPAAKQADNEEEFKDAKKQFSAAKRELKQVLEQQQIRLFEAMCTGRRWTYADWQEFLNQHPIVGRYCQSLVWGVFEPATEQQPEQLLLSFRPITGGEITDLDDESPSIQPHQCVGLLHSAITGAKLGTAWQEHFTDYEVKPLFEQFPSNTFTPTTEQLNATSIDAFHGHMIETYALRGVCNKRGYQRGQAEDGGWFTTYLKEFPGLGLTAELEFTGNCLPEENIPAALNALRFVAKEDAGGWSSNRGKRLADISPVLLAECYNDVAAMAAKGTGYDAEWQKKAGY